jgi:hypothetical protein
MKKDFEAIRNTITPNTVESSANLDYRPNKRKMELNIFHLSGYQGVSEIPELPCITFSRRAIDKAGYLALRSKTEVGWNWVVEKCDDGFFVHDLWVFPQVVTLTTFRGLAHEKQFGIMHQAIRNRYKELLLSRFRGHTHVDMYTIPSQLDEDVLSQNVHKGAGPLVGKEHQWSWGVIVNRLGDFQLMITNPTLLYNHFVTHAPWQIDERDTWDGDVSELEDALNYVRGWKAYGQTTKIVEATKLKTMEVEVAPKAMPAPVESEASSAPAADFSAVEQEESSETSSQKATPPRVQLDKNAKVTFDPKWQKQYHHRTSRPLLPDPDWIDISGFGILTREEVAKGTIVWIRPGTKIVLEDGSEVLLTLVPFMWLPDIVCEKF